MDVKRIKDFFWNNYKLIIPIGFMFVLFIAFFLYYEVSLRSNYTVDKEESVFQYFYDKRYDYKAIVSKNRKGVIVGFNPVDVKINLDSSPIYLSNGRTVILPHDMSVVMPTMSCAEYLAKGYSYVDFKNSVFTLVTNRYHDRLNHYFFYDGNDLYFFIESVTLRVNNEKITLSPYSYVIVQYNNYLSYYDFKSDTFKILTIDNHNIIAENDFYKILLDRDVIDYQGQNVILTSKLENLNTIDKKG